MAPAVLKQGNLQAGASLLGQFQPKFLMAFVFTWVFVPGANAASISTVYDMTPMLNEPHPFAGQMGFRWYPEVPSPPPPTAIKTQPSEPGLTTTSTRITTTDANAPRSEKESVTAQGMEPKSYRWLSEIRVGAIKHAVSITGSRSKETGIDANMEVLFGSPSWFNILWSPRPHLGANFNTSSTNTDFVYTGLTWEWRSWRSIFIDASFGFAIHNGILKNDAGVVFPPDVGRKRELGTRFLFRESIEIGVAVTEHHSLSIIWDHLSNAGLFGEQNEGLDNIGIRYGYRF